MQFCRITRKEPVGDIDLNLPGVQQGVTMLVLHQGLLEDHLIEKRKINVSYADAGVQAGRQTVGDF
jgi:hypothetical protein